MRTVVYSFDEVAHHNSHASCWVIIRGAVYDVTELLSAHPGGAEAILRYGGKDATTAFEPIHPADALEKNLPPEKLLGVLNTDTREAENERLSKTRTQDELRVENEQKKKPPLARVLSTFDMEEVARKVLPYKAWTYYSSAGDDEITLRENKRAFSRYFFCPRVLRPILHCDPSTSILGFKSTIPVFASAAALAKLGHPAGEANITRACGRSGLIQMVSSNASLSYAEIASARVCANQPLFFQLYKHVDELAVARIREVERLGYNAIFLTVDAVVPGSRELDVHAPFVLAEQEGILVENNLSEGRRTPSVLPPHVDRDMTWEKTIPWLRSVTKLPIVIKGIQCVEDAVLAAEAGVDGIVISNHGGRQLDYSLPSVDVLYRLHKQRPDVFSKLEVFMDGGIRRGTDILKALCLGARAVGIGRAFLYAQSAYGEEGVTRLINILQSELVRGMQQLGARDVSCLVPEMVEKVDWKSINPKL